MHSPISSAPPRHWAPRGCNGSEGMKSVLNPIFCLPLGYACCSWPALQQLKVTEIVLWVLMSVVPEGKLLMRQGKQGRRG